MKKVRVKNEMEELAAAEVAAMGDDDDEDEEEDAMDVDVAAPKGVLGEEDDEDSEGAFASSPWLMELMGFRAVDEDFKASSSEEDSGGSGDDSD